RALSPDCQGSRDKGHRRACTILGSRGPPPRDRRISRSSPRLIIRTVMKQKASRRRLDLLLVERSFADSPQKAMAMILAGEVQVDGRRAEKAGMPVEKGARIEIISRAQKFVSRGGVKMEGALQDSAIDPSGRVCLDIGASNGGFTDCLLQHGAARVYAVDVNVEQLDWKLRKNPLVTPIERNARELCAEDLPDRKSTRLNSSHGSISYAVFCLKKKKKKDHNEMKEHILHIRDGNHMIHRNNHKKSNNRTPNHIIYRL